MPQEHLPPVVVLPPGKEIRKVICIIAKPEIIEWAISQDVEQLSEYLFIRARLR